MSLLLILKCTTHEGYPSNTGPTFITLWAAGGSPEFVFDIVRRINVFQRYVPFCLTRDSQRFGEGECNQVTSKASKPPRGDQVVNPVS